jgi:hypothetical protein
VAILRQLLPIVPQLATVAGQLLASGVDTGGMAFPVVSTVAARER